MEKNRRTERMSAMMKILSDAPNKIHTLSQFCELFGAAKSTMSEDIDSLKRMVEIFELGELPAASVIVRRCSIRLRVRISASSARK